MKAKRIIAIAVMTAMFACFATACKDSGTNAEAPAKTEATNVPAGTNKTEAAAPAATETPAEETVAADSSEPAADAAVTEAPEEEIKFLPVNHVGIDDIICDELNVSVAEDCYGDSNLAKNIRFSKIVMDNGKVLILITNNNDKAVSVAPRFFVDNIDYSGRAYIVSGHENYVYESTFSANDVISEVRIESAEIDDELTAVRGYLSVSVSREIATDIMYVAASNNASKRSLSGSMNILIFNKGKLVDAKAVKLTVKDTHSMLGTSGLKPGNTNTTKINVPGEYDAVMICNNAM